MAFFVAPRSLHAEEPWQKLGDGSYFAAPEKSVQDAGKLLVLLHGDGDDPRRLLRAWEPARTEGVTLLAVACPTSLGCAGSFWRWNGDPAYVTKVIAQIEARRGATFDERSRALVGWSGGASYIGYRSQAFEALFPRILFHGGGIPPAQTTCLEHSQAAVAFFVGDKNPLHYLATTLREYYTQCHADVTFTLLPGKNHGGEWLALTKARVAEWLAWLFPRPLAASPVTGPTDYAIKAPATR